MTWSAPCNGKTPPCWRVNRAIAQAAEQSHNISKLQAAGLLDTDACAAKLNAINIQLTQLRRERRRLLEHDDIEDTIGRLHQTADAIKAGPERLDTFDEDLFEELVEEIVAESQTRIRFRLHGGIELAEKVGGQNGELSEDTVWLSDPKRRTDPSAGGGRCGQSHSGPLPGRLSYQKLADLLNQKNIPSARKRRHGTSTRSNACWRTPVTPDRRAIRPS